MVKLIFYVLESLNIYIVTISISITIKMCIFDLLKYIYLEILRGIFKYIYLEILRGIFNSHESLNSITWHYDHHGVLLQYADKKSIHLRGHTYRSVDTYNVSNKDGCLVLFSMDIENFKKRFMIGQVSHFRYVCSEELDPSSYSAPHTVFIMTLDERQMECFLNGSQFLLLPRSCLKLFLF